MAIRRQFSQKNADIQIPWTSSQFYVVWVEAFKSFLLSKRQAEGPRYKTQTTTVQATDFLFSSWGEFCKKHRRT